ncbi:MAG: Uma2 family endonuclease [Microcystaceae cyanobacterium]
MTPPTLLEAPPLAIENIVTIETDSEIIFPTGEFWSDEPPLETIFHLRQIVLLINCLEWLWQERQDFFVAGNLTIYYSPNQRKSEHFRGPDFFVVLGVERNLPRRSWVVWQEGGKYPNVIIEVLSNSTKKVDKGEKLKIYQDIFRTPNYFWFDPETQDLAGFRLLEGRYQPIEANPQGWLWSQELDLYLGVYEQQLRYFTKDGKLVATPEEAAREAQEALVLERQQREAVEQKLQALEARFLSLGLDAE